MKFKVILLSFIILFSTIVCSLVKLEHKLAPDIKEWYTLHGVLMESKVPQWIDNRWHKSISEQRHFLTLSPELQRIYIKKYFWKIRMEGLAGVFYERIDIANRMFNEGGKAGWDTDRGQIFIKHGFPIRMYYYRDTNRFGESYTNNPDIEGNSLQIWDYMMNFRMVTYMFIWRSGTWTSYYLSAFTMGDQSTHHQEFIKAWAPTEEGWLLWSDYLYNKMIKK